MSKVTIVVPIYNVENYLRRNLETLKEQTYTDIEVLCVNDGSIDNSGKIIDDFVQHDQRFKRLDKENGGLSDARNYGLKYASGKYIMFIDSDDFVSKDMVKACVERMEKDNLDMVVFDYQQHYDETNSDEVIHIPFDDEKVYSLKENKELLAYCNNAAWNKMYRTALFTDNLIEYPFGYRHQDLGTTFRLIYYSERIGFINRPLYYYLVDRPNNISQMIDKNLYHILDMCKINVDFYKSVNLFEDIKEELKYLCMINFNVALRKAIKLKDRKFVFNFIDQIFDFMKLNFGNLKFKKYSPISYKSDKIYLSRWKTKAYYIYHKYR